MRSRHFSRPAAASVLLAALLALAAGCGGDDRSEAELVFVSGTGHHTLDPQRMSWLHDIRLARALFEPLTRWRVPEMEPKPGVAASWRVENGGRRYVFRLRESARWSNGDPVTADDFVFAWRRALLPDLAADYTQLLFDIRGARAFFDWRARQLERVAAGDLGARAAWRAAKERFAERVGIAAPDARTLVVRLERPVPYFLGLCAFSTLMPVHAESVEAATRLDPSSGMRKTAGAYWSDPDRLVTNGPYVLERRRPRRDVRLRANPRYWNREAVESETILEQIVTEPQTAMLRYERGEADWLPDIPSASSLAADLAAAGRDDVHVTRAAGTYFYNFNCAPERADGSRNPLHDPRLRRALSMAIDRETIVEKVTRVGQDPARTFVPPGVIADYQPPVSAGVTYAPDRARELLAEAGHAGGEGLTDLSILYNTEGSHERIAERVARGWSDTLGVSVDLEGLDSKAFGQRLDEGRFTIARAGWFGDYPDPSTFLDKFHSENGNNDANFRDERFDARLEEARATAAGPKRRRLLERAEARMLDKQPVAPIYHYVTLDVFDPERVRGLAPNPWNVHRLDRIRAK